MAVFFDLCLIIKEIRLWSLSSQKCTWSANAHRGFVKGLCFIPFNDRLISVGDDKTVKLWDPSSQAEVEDYLVLTRQPLNVFMSRNAFTGIDHHRSEQIFATSSTQIDIWNYDR